MTEASPRAPAGFIDWLIGRTPFASVQSVEGELTKLGYLRWILGALCLARVLPILLAYPDYAPLPMADAAQVLRWGWWVVFLVVLCSAGIAVPLVLPVLFYSFKQFDRLSHANSLAATMLCLVWLLFILTSAGAGVSVDALLLKSRSRLGALMRALYGLFGLPSLAQLRALYLLFFLAYALMHFGAWIFHRGVDAWQDGSLLRILLTSSYFSREWSLFRALEAWWPTALVLLSRVGTFGQIVFQAAMIPLFFTRWGSRFVVLWGWVFAILSTFLLQLSYLPVFEIVLWAALFIRPRHAAQAPADVGVMVRGRMQGWLVTGAGYVVLVVFVLTQMPYLSTYVAIRNPTLLALPFWFGLDVPKVFNQDDLRLGDVWPVIYRGSREELLPYHGPDGERLTWVQWNDLILYTSSVAWRQGYLQYVGSPVWEETVSAPLLRIAAFDHRRRQATNSTFVVDYFSSQGSDRRLSVAERFVRQPIRSSTIRCAGSGADALCTVGP
jgi:hypothetical protein